jgi:hypothetical protein
MSDKTNIVVWTGKICVRYEYREVDLLIPNLLLTTHQALLLPSKTTNCPLVPSLVALSICSTTPLTPTSTLVNICSTPPSFALSLPISVPKYPGCIGKIITSLISSLNFLARKFKAAFEAPYWGELNGKGISALLIEPTIEEMNTNFGL